MTNIQAIDLLKGLEQSLDDYCELNDEGKTAFRMAITALEVFGLSEQLPAAQQEPIKINIEDFNKEDWERLKKEWGNTPITVLPSAQPERKTGRWIPHEDEDGEHYGDKCSECGGWYVMPYGKTNFCPNCGADMRGEQDE